MVPLIQDEIVEKRKWIDKEDFIDLLALTQSVPGIFAVNIAIFIGYKLRKFKGALAMALGTILPSFFIILAIALFFQQFRDNETVQSIFKGIRPAVVALIAAPTFKMGKSAKIGMTHAGIFHIAAFLCAAPTAKRRNATRFNSPFCGRRGDASGGPRRNFSRFSQKSCTLRSQV